MPTFRFGYRDVEQQRIPRLCLPQSREHVRGQHQPRLPGAATGVETVESRVGEQRDAAVAEIPIVDGGIGRIRDRVRAR
ncbi:hypothetical protein A5767_21730 [Rhodococcus sp. 852002-51564_SCH6189132-a]|nr:hypothetical protein A5767_21730 [Rhodococcus sp. 852002-51564_SCH6189132-a]